MASPEIKLADGLMLPANATSQVYAFMGRRGSGKTYGAGRFAEQLLAVGHQVVILDPVGVWWGLRLASDGAGRGFDIPVFGGGHGDIPLEVTGGKVVAELVAAQRTPLVLDVSEFTEAEQRRFVADFASELFQAKKRNRSPVMVALEEAQEFCPQHVEGGDARMVGAVQRLAKLGRNFGIGLAVISQRPQDVNKKLLNQTEVMLCFQLTGPQERKAIEGWVQEKGTSGRDELGLELPALPVGTAIVWSPQWLSVYGKFKIARKRTYDASATPDSSDAAAAAPLAAIDLKAVRTAMAETIEAAKQNDPAELRAEVAALRRELAAARRSAPAAPPVEVRVPFVPRHVIGDIEGARRRVVEIGDALSDLDARLESAINGSELRPAPETAAAAPRERPRAVPRAAPNGDAGGRAAGIGGGALEVLSTLAAAGGRLTKRQLATLCGIRPSVSTLRNYISLLKREELVSVDGNDVVITRVGAGRVGDPPALKTAAELLAMWRANLPQKPGEILSVFAAEHGPFTGEVIRKRCNVPPGGSTLRNYLSILRSNGLIHKARGGLVVNPLLAH